MKIIIFIIIICVIILFILGTMALAKSRGLNPLLFIVLSGPIILLILAESPSLEAFTNEKDKQRHIKQGNITGAFLSFLAILFWIFFFIICFKFNIF